MSHHQIGVGSYKLCEGSLKPQMSIPNAFLSQVCNIKDMWQVDPLAMFIQDYFVVKMLLLK
jgi:hypothetical protein